MRGAHDVIRLFDQIMLSDRVRRRCFKLAAMDHTDTVGCGSICCALSELTLAGATRKPAAAKAIIGVFIGTSS